MSRIRTLSASEAAYVLRQALGPNRAWGDFLADVIQGRADFYGLVLKPFATVKNRCDRPVYLVADVTTFIKAARRLAGIGPGTSKVEVQEVEVPASHMHALIPWRFRRGVRVPGAAA